MLDDMHHTLELLLQIGTTCGQLRRSRTRGHRPRRIQGGSAQITQRRPLGCSNSKGTSVPKVCNRAFMPLQTGRIFEPEVSGTDGYWVRVAVAQDVRFPDQFQCVALPSRGRQLMVRSGGE
jgi:hypothetical protein